MRLLAISDLHLGHPANRDRLSSIGASPEDWLILAGGVGETEAHLTLAFEHLTSRFAKLIWVPGNHELWTVEQSPKNLRGKTRYEALVAWPGVSASSRPSIPIRNGRKATGR